MLNSNVTTRFLALAILLHPVGFVRAEPSNTAQVRSFTLNYGATISGLDTGADVRVWLPVPPSDEYQTVRQIGHDLPVAGSLAAESTYGNQILYFRTRGPRSGRLSLTNNYLVMRKEVRGLQTKTSAKLGRKQRALFLAPSTKVPVTGRPIRLLDNLKLPQDSLSLGRLLYDRVDEHVQYDKSQPGYGSGDVLWVCDSRTGNCTDFHSLFISFARSQGVPARFEIGFPLPARRGRGVIAGYHCWAYFFVAERGWVPVDISEADKHPEMKDYYFGNLTENRVALSVGRDIELVPRQTGPPLNYFVYPYVEVNGKPLPKNQLDLTFSFRDVP